MLLKILKIFKRDLKVNSRDFISLYIIVFPVLFAIGINLFAPGINDTTVNLALLKNESEMIEYLSDYAKIEVFDSLEDLKSRINRRDDIVGIVSEGSNGSYIMSQGNESEHVVTIAKALKAFYDLDYKLEETNVQIHDFGRTVPPLKKILVNCGILMISVIGGMLITMNLVEEKADNTVSAIMVTPISRIGYILGKCIMGVLLAVLGTVILIWLTGFKVNIGQTILAVFSCSLISIIIGFVQGVSSDDVMQAMAGIKMLFLPMAGGIAAFHLLSDKWQVVVYWLPFYWTYKNNDAILSNTSTWSQTLICTTIVLVITLIIYILLLPRIRKGLER